jgi:hypothetical protein
MRKSYQRFSCGCECRHQWLMTSITPCAVITRAAGDFGAGGGICGDGECDLGTFWLCMLNPGSRTCARILVFQPCV